VKKEKNERRGEKKLNIKGKNKKETQTQTQVQEATEKSAIYGMLWLINIKE
jgi:hypothetical protein